MAAVASGEPSRSSDVDEAGVRPDGDERGLHARRPRPASRRVSTRSRTTLSAIMRGVGSLMRRERDRATSESGPHAAEPTASEPDVLRQPAAVQGQGRPAQTRGLGGSGAGPTPATLRHGAASPGRRDRRPCPQASRGAAESSDRTRGRRNADMVAPSRVPARRGRSSCMTSSKIELLAHPLASRWPPTDDSRLIL